MRYVIWSGGSAVGHRLAAELKAELLVDPTLISADPGALIVAPYGAWPAEQTEPYLRTGGHLLLLPPFPVGEDLVAKAGASHSVTAVPAGAQNRVRLESPLTEVLGRSEVRIAYQQILETVLNLPALALSDSGDPVVLLLQARNTWGCLGLCAIQLAQPSGMTDALDRRDLLKAVVEYVEELLVMRPVDAVLPASERNRGPEPTIPELPLAMQPLLNLALVAMAVEPEGDWNAERLANACEALTLAPVSAGQSVLLHSFLTGIRLLVSEQVDLGRLEAALDERPALRSMVEIARKERLNG